MLAPVVRKRLPTAPILPQAVAFAAPVGLCVAVRRTRARDLAVCGLQMWAYLAAYKSPHDDAEAQAVRTHVDYPIAVDRMIGLGQLPTLRLQRALAHRGPAGPEWRPLDRVLVWTHWTWFMVPHGSLLYVMARRPERFARAALMTYAVFDIGATFYWLAPTAPPWYDAEEALARPQPGPGVWERGERSRPVPDGHVRRLMVEYGEQFWRDGWGPLYSVLGGNPLAAMPSIHFATSLMAALLLAEVGPLAGAFGFTYAIVLGFALVYLGEHYVVDLLAGAALAGAVHRLGPRAGGVIARAGRAVGTLEAVAHGAV
jgi:membrane-associated phospholipid phosphatase